MPKLKRKAVPTARVIRDTRNAELDYYIPLSLAKDFHKRGHMYYLPDCDGYEFTSQPGRKRVALVVH